MNSNPAFFAPLLLCVFAFSLFSTCLAAEPPDDVSQRRAKTLASMQEVMGPLPDRSHLPPLDIRTSETQNGEGYTRQTISFANLYDERVTALLYIPSNI